MSDISLRMSITENASKQLGTVADAAVKAAEQMKKAGQVMDKAFTSSAPNSFASRTGNAINSVCSEAENLGNVINEAVGGFEDFSSVDISGMESAFSSAASGAQDFSETARKIGERMDDISDSAKEAGESINGVGDNSSLDSLSSEADSAGQAMDNASSKALNLGNALKTMFAAVGAAKIAGAVKDFTADSIELGKSYTSMISEVQAISGASQEEMVQLEQVAREYGATTVFSASESAEALKYMSLAGWSADQSSSALGGVLNLAAASGMGLGESSDMVTDYLSAFGMQADQSDYFADLLAYSQSNSNTTAAQLGEAFRNSAANLNAAGQDVETVTSFLEGMANQGYKGSEAGTAMAAIMRDITNAMEDGAVEIGKTSVAVMNEKGNYRDLTDIITDVSDAVDGMGSAERAAALSSTFTADSTKGLNLILNEGIDKIAGYEEELRMAGGTAEKMADIMNDNLSGDMANMNSAFEEMQLQVFEGMEEPLRDGVQYITSDIIPALTEWVPDAFASVADTISEVGSAVSPLFTTLLKNPKGVATALTSIGTGVLAFKTVSSVPDTIEKLTGSVGKFGEMITSHPYAAAAAGIAAAVVAIKGAVDEYNEIRIDENLAEHFGDISLDDQQVETLASQIMPVETIAQFDFANTKFEGADGLIETAEAALEENGYLVWKVANVGLELTDGEKQEVISNGQEFVDSIAEAFQENEYGAETTVKALLGDQSGAVIEVMQGWFNADNAQLETLSEAFTNILENSFGNGISGIDTAEIQTQVEDILQDAFSSGITDADELSETIAGKLEAFLGEGAGLVDTEMLAGDIGSILREAMTGENVDTEGLSSSIAELLQGSIDSGVSDVDTSTALSILQTKMMQMVNGAKQSELKGQLDWLSITSSGAALDSESWAETVGKVSEYQTALMEADEQAYQSMLATVEQAVANDPSRQGEADAILKAVEMAYNDLNASTLATAWDWMYGSLSDDKAYGEELSVLQEAMDSSSFREKIIGTDWQSGLAFAETDLESAISEQFKYLDEGTRGALADRYEAMLPSIGQMEKIISEAAEDGKAVPEALMDSYREAMTIGAAAGDTDAMWKYMALETAQEFPGMDEFLSTLEENGMDFAQFPEAVQEYFKNAFTDTTDADYSWLTDELASEFAKEGGPDWENVWRLLDEQGIEVDLSEIPVTATGEPDIEEIARSISGLEATGEKYTINGEDYIKYEAVSGDTLWSYASQIAEEESQIPALVEQIASASEIDDPDNIHIGQEIMVPAEFALEADTSDIAREAGETADEVRKEAEEAVGDTPAETEQVVNTTYEKGNVDTGNLETKEEELKQEPVEEHIPASIVIELQNLDDAELQEGINGVMEERDAIPVDVPADVNILAGEISTGEMTAAAVEQTRSNLLTAFEQVFPVPGKADVELTEENNAPDIYNEVGNAVRDAFSAGFNASAHVAVTLTADYSLANPTKTITFSGAATGSAVVSAALHAEGGYFDEPHLGIVAEAGVGEYIIPMDGSERSLGMWEEAGRMLGADTESTNPVGPAFTSQGNDASSGGASTEAGNEKTINLNINGSGKIQGSGASREEILQVIMDNIKGVIMDMLQDDILMEGDGAYEY